MNEEVGYLVKVGVPARYAKVELEGLYPMEGFDLLKAEKAKYRSMFDDMKKIIADHKVGLYMTGINGCGKTVAACACLKEYRRAGYSVARTTTGEILKWYFNNFQGLRGRYKAAQVLLIEEVGKEADFENQNFPKIFEGLIKIREEKNFITLFTANAPLSWLKERYGDTVFHVIKGTTLNVRFPKIDLRELEITKYEENLRS